MAKEKMKMREEFFENEENVGGGVMRGHLSIGIKDGYYAVLASPCL